MVQWGIVVDGKGWGVVGIATLSTTHASQQLP
jgi:hypothetical protein